MLIVEPVGTGPDGTAGKPIPLRGWEQGRAEPDGSAKVLLAAIAADLEGVARAARHAGDPAFLASGGGWPPEPARPAALCRPI